MPSNWGIYKKHDKTFLTGFTLVETLIGIAILVLIILGIFSAIVFTYKIIYQSRVQILATQVANGQLELIRNLPYEQVGIAGGWPSGTIPYEQTIERSGVSFKVITTIRYIDDPFDGTVGGTPNDLASADYKEAEIEVSCLSCQRVKSILLSTRVSPKGLESSSGGGALFFTVFDAAGEPVPQANLHIEKDADHNGQPEFVIDDVTGNNGELRLVDLPPAVEGYKISAAKSGYSADQTIVSTPENPNPLKPPATVVSREITRISFAIDKVSSFNLKTQNSFCQAIGGAGLETRGSKIIGANPDIYKYNQTVYTNAAGEKNLANLEWDTYYFSLPIGSSYDLAGSIPTLPVGLPPAAVYDLVFILQIHTANSLLVTIKDSATKLPLSGAKITLTQGSFIAEKLTGRGYLRQTDWSGGAGQADFVDETKFWQQDGNLEINSPAGDLTLKKIGGKYYAAGYLFSSAFDLGAPTNFSNLIWEPLAQPPACGAESVKFQIATASTSTPLVWDFKGPDGTASSSYTASNTNISSVHNGERYLRYKLILATEDDHGTPQISEVAVSFTSGCVPPGQAFFSGLSAATYTVTVELAGYQTINTAVAVSGRSQVEILMSP